MNQLKKLIRVVIPSLIVVFLVCISTNNVHAAEYYVSTSGDNSDGSSWDTAWDELDQIDWAEISAGDTIYLDGGSSSMTYSTSMFPTASGTSDNPISIELSTESGHDGQAIFHGGRLADLPECGQDTYSPYATSDDITQLSYGIRWDGVSYITLDGKKWEGIVITKSTYGMRFYNDSSNIAVKNVKIYDNGNVLQADDGTSTDLWYPESPGIRIEGSDHTFYRINVHDNGQDGMQSGGSTPNNLDNITIQESWFHNTRIHSGTDNGPDGDAADELGAPSEGPNYNGYEESFNWCRHSDAIQIYNGGDVDGFLLEDSIFGPGHTNTLLLGDTSGGGATMLNTIIRDSLIIKGADNNLNGKEGLSDHDNWTIDNVTIHSPNTKTNGIRIYGTDHNITDSIFYGGNAFFENSLATDTGNCVYDMTGHSFGSIFSDPMFASITDDAFTQDDYEVSSDSACTGKGSSLTSINDLLILVGAIAETSSTTSGSSIPGPPSCNQQSPANAVSLFQASATCTSVDLYFTPLPGANYYHFMYGRDENANEFGATYYYDPLSYGVTVFPVHLLDSSEIYYFKILPANQCAPGYLSNTLKVTTTSSCNLNAIYYAN